MVHKATLKGNVFELTDIFQDYNDARLIENIAEIMKREGIWKKGFHIVFPSGGLEIVNYQDGFYQKDFEVFSSPNDIAFVGTSYGMLQKMRKTPAEIIDMNIELRKG